jgi:hypothetical protein
MEMAETETDPKKLAKELREPLTIVVTSKAWACGGYSQSKEEEIDIVNVKITAKDSLNCVVIAGNVVKALKELKLEPEVKILP